MSQFPLTALATIVALVVYFYMGLRVAGARRQFGIEAPATTGHPIFERHFRVQMNTLEWLPMFLPSLWIFAAYWGDVAAGALGAVWSFGRVMYMFTYVADPKTRGPWFGIQAFTTLGLWVGVLTGVAQTLLR